jgi:uncharacterized membrane protein
MSYPTREQSVLSVGADTSSTAMTLQKPAGDPRKRDTSTTNGAHTLARALGWFSIGLGLTELLAPRKLGRAIGFSENDIALLPLMGLREIATGAGVLAPKNPRLGIRARVAGDLIDLALLNRAFQSPDSAPDRVLAAAAAVAGVTALDVLCAVQLPSETQPITPVRASVAINRSAEELYTFFRNFGNLPRVFQHVSDVQAPSDRRSHWVVTGPAGAKLEWDAEITEEVPNESLRWRALPNSDVDAEGRLVLKQLPQGHGTLVTLEVQYPARGARARVISKVFDVALEQRIKNDLRRWKQLMETGEIATTEGQPSGKRSFISRRLP